MRIDLNGCAVFRLNPISLPKGLQREIWNGIRDYEYAYFVIPDNRNTEDCFITLMHTDLSADITAQAQVIDYIQCGNENIKIIHPDVDVLIGILADCVNAI